MATATLAPELFPLLDFLSQDALFQFVLALPAMIRAFIQARMSSSRFPGKVLAPFLGRAILAHVVERVALVIPRDRIVLATSQEASDDPLAAYSSTLGLSVFRGSLLNVFERFRNCLEANPADYFFRVCADSPLLEPSIHRRFLEEIGKTDVDLVTNVHPRTFPRGHSVELLKSQTFLRINPGSLSKEECEHVTRIYYNDRSRFRVLNVESGDPELAARNLCVDTIDDLRRLENLVQ